MSNVYLKNRTSSAITVAGYTVHYMDKTDAEIVEVEDVENITSSDDASGTISAMTLPTAHSYTNVLFDSLRYYAKGTFSNTGTVGSAYGVINGFDYGTITWTDESLGDLSSKIDVNPPSSSAMISQSVFKIIFITDSSITGYSPDVGAGQISDYTYNNGVHSITFYFAGRWIDQPYVGRIQFRYLDGVTTFNNLNAFDLISVSEGSLSKDTTTDRYDMYNVWDNSITIHAQYSVQNYVKYNAFKYLLSFVPYWYVIDGIQTDWTDDLSSIGYSEVVPLPKVTFRNGVIGTISAQGTQTVPDGSSVYHYIYSDGAYHLTEVDAGVVLAVQRVTDSSAQNAIYHGFTAERTQEGYIRITNNTGTTYTNMYGTLVSVCSSNQATVVHVYDKATGVAYNAFTYTLEGTDYYYILDGVQSDWSDDIDSLGFALGDGFTEITLYFSSSSNFAMQGKITSGFTGNVNSAYIYQLYTDAEHTTPWNGYDYSNDYEIGYYSSGNWVKRPIVQEMPDSTTSEQNSVISWILLDTGYVWGVSNIDTASRTLTFGNGSITVRIYPKDQQWIPVFPYNPSYGEYDNLSTNRKGTFVRMGSPATVFGTFPVIAESFGYKSGMIKSTSIQAELQTSQTVLYLNVIGNPALSNIVVRFENDICTGYVRSDKADLPTAPSYDGAKYTLMDDNGNYIDYDDSFTYKFVLLLDSTGDAVGGTYSTGAMIKSSTGKLQVRLRYMSSKFNRVWYYRISIS